jgi:hypothetical protein
MMRDSAVATVFGAGLFMMAVWSQSWAGPAHQADQAGGWLVGKGTPVTLDHYQCRYQKDCGAASQKCWGAGQDGRCVHGGAGRNMWQRMATGPEVLGAEVLGWCAARAAYVAYVRRVLRDAPGDEREIR